MRDERRRDERSVRFWRGGLLSLFLLGGLLAFRAPAPLTSSSSSSSSLHLLDLSLLSSLFWSESENRLGTCGGCTHSVCGRRRAAAGSPRLTPRPVCAREVIYLHSGSHVHVCVSMYDMCEGCCSRASDAIMGVQSVRVLCERDLVYRRCLYMAGDPTASRGYDPYPFSRHVHVYMCDHVLVACAFDTRT